MMGRKEDYSHANTVTTIINLLVAKRLCMIDCCNSEMNKNHCSFNITYPCHSDIEFFFPSSSSC